MQLGIMQQCRHRGASLVRTQPTASSPFAAARWKGGNPEETDLFSFRNLLGVMPSDIKRVVFTSSAGVERQGSFPFLILNLFGKHQSTHLLARSGRHVSAVHRVRL